MQLISFSFIFFEPFVFTEIASRVASHVGIRKNGEGERADISSGEQSVKP